MQTRKKSARRGLLVSATSLLLSVAMLVGTTFAWFTDSVSSGVNKIQAGNLDIELTHKSASAREEEVTESVKLFKDLNGGDIHWEPGAVTWETFTVSNVGTLALKYQLAMNIVGNNWVVDTAGQTTTRSLKDVIKVYIFDEDKSADFSSREAVVNAVKALNADTLEDFIVNGSMQARGDSKSYTVVLYWKPQANDQDNLYNLQNGLKASDAAANEVGKLYIDLGIKLNATQYTSENDSFGPDYDADADGVNDYTGHQTVASTKATLNTTGDTTLTTNNTPAKVNQTTVTIPQNAIEVNPGEENATLELTAKTTTIELANITDFVVTGSDTSGAVAAIDLTLTKTVDNTVTEVTDFANGQSVEVVTYITAGLSEGSVDVVYTGNDGKDHPREVQYDPETGRLSFKTNHFSNYVATTTDVAYNATKSKGYNTVQAAIDDAEGENGTIRLLNNVELSSALTVSKDFTIDLNGKTLTMPNASQSIGEMNATNNKFNVKFTNGKIVTCTAGTKSAFAVYTGSSLTVDNVMVDASQGSAFFACGEDAELTITNSKVLAQIYCVSTNANSPENYGVKITLKNSDFIAESNDGDNAPVMINVGGSLDIDNCNISGQRQGAIVRAGEATIKNSSIVLNGVYANKTQYYTGTWGSGNEVPAAALVIGNYHSGDATAYMAAANVTLTNTTVSASEGYAAIYMDSNNTYEAQLIASDLSGTDIYLGQNTSKVVVSEIGANNTYYVSDGAALEKVVDTGKDQTIVLLADCQLNKVLEVKQNLTIIGEGDNKVKIHCPSNGDRVVNATKNTTPITLQFKNVDLIGPTTGTYTRGISFYQNSEITLVMDGCGASANYYAINVASENEKTNVLIKNASLIGGWCAFQTWSSNTTATFEDCTLIGNNDKSYNAEGWNNFATVVINENATGVELTFKNCRIEANQTTGNKQYLLSARASGSKVTLNDCTFFSNGSEISDEALGNFLNVYQAAIDLDLSIDDNTIKIG